MEGMGVEVGFLAESTSELGIAMALTHRSFLAELKGIYRCPTGCSSGKSVAHGGGGARRCSQYRPEVRGLIALVFLEPGCWFGDGRNS
jgi:hypothetical protein